MEQCETSVTRSPLVVALRSNTKKVGANITTQSIMIKKKKQKSGKQTNNKDCHDVIITSYSASSCWVVGVGSSIITNNDDRKGEQNFWKVNEETQQQRQ